MTDYLRIRILTFINSRLYLAKVIFLVMLTGCSLTANHPSAVASHSDASVELDNIADTVWQHALEREPYLRIKAGIPVHFLPDISYQDAVSEAAFSQSILKRLAQLPAESLSHQQRLTSVVMQRALQHKINDLEHYWLSFVVTPYIGGYRLGSITNILGTSSIEHAEGRARYLRLIGEYGDMLSQMHAKLVAQEERGILLPKAAIPGAVKLYSGYLDLADSLFAVKPVKLGGLRVAEQQEFQQQIRQTVSARIIPAFERIIRYLGPDYIAKAPETVGLAQYPNGKAYYRHLLKKYTLEQETPEQLFNYGQRRVAELSQGLNAIRDEIGFTGTATTFHEKLASDPQFFAATPEEVEQRYLRYIHRIEPLIEQYFYDTPEAPYGVKRLDSAQEAGMTFGYYQAPTPEQPIGQYRYNGSNLEQRSLLYASHLIYHELIPGHHFQLSLQMENQQLPMVRRELFISPAFIEGWAEYASHLADEMGVRDDPYDRYGHLLSQMLFAVRLVVDTGMNYFGWSLQQAREFMAQHLLYSDLEIASETLRYATDLPGQALGYAIAHRTIEELRSEAEQALGEQFDLRQFHRAVLDSGSLDLDTLRVHIHHYIDQTKLSEKR